MDFFHEKPLSRPCNFKENLLKYQYDIFITEAKI